jgi:glycosyltransferase involved in cell wall biosynthesis
MKMKTCIVTGQYPPQIGGVGHSAQRVANMLARSGMSVHVAALQKHVTPLPFEESIASVSEGGVLVHRIKVHHPDCEKEAAGGQAELLTRYNREIFHALEHLQRRYKYEVFHAFFLYPAGFIAGLVGRLHEVKVIVSIRGNDVGKYVFDPLRLPFIRSALENADYVTSVAASLLNLASRAITPLACKAKTILNSIDAERLSPQGRPALNLKGTVIGTSGLFRYKKGLRHLFQALAGLEDRCDYTLLLAGDYFKDEDRVAHVQYLHEYRLHDRAIVTGKIPPERMAEYLQLFDIMVFPSLFSEGCPLALLEGMALGKAVIGSRTGAIPEIIRDRENGLLVNPGSAAEIGKAIMTLIESPALRKRLGENAAATARAMTAERELRQWREVYAAVMC